MLRSNNLGLVLIVGLGLVALGFIFVWQTGGHISLGPLFGDGRVVEQVGGKSTKFKSGELHTGDTILAVNGIKVGNWRSCYKVLEALSQPGIADLRLTVLRTNDKTHKTDRKTVKLKRERIKTLVLKGAPRNHTPDVDTYKATAEGLYDAASNGNATAVEQILDAGGKKYINELTDNQTPLIAAVSNGNLAVVRVLIENGADVNATAGDKTTPLMKAAALGNRDLVAALMAAGAKTDMRNSQLKTAADIAGAQGFSDVETFIQDPRPTMYLSNDQRRKAIEQLMSIDVLKNNGYEPSDAQMTDAIKAYQRQNKLPVTGILTADNLSRLKKDVRKRLHEMQSKYQDETTKRTLSRVFSRAMTNQWTPVGSDGAYPQCENENIAFTISPDQRVITWKSYRPGTLGAGLAKDEKPAQTASYKVMWADQSEGFDRIMVKPQPAPLSGPRYQLWEIGARYIKVTPEKHAKLDGGENGENHGEGEGAAQGLADSDMAGSHSSYLAMCGS
jgi:hypothetical protein